MVSTTVRVSDATRQKLRELAASTGQSMQGIVDQAVEEYRRRRFLERVNVAFAALRGNPEAWQAEVEERRQIDGTLGDGLADE